MMVLGDSLTWGVGLAVEERFTAIAEDLLNRASAGATFDVLNFGPTGNPTVVERDILEAYKDLVEPDLVVVGFCSNDPQPGRMDHSIERENLRRSMTGRGVVRAAVFVRSLGFPYVSRLLRDGFYALAERAGLIPGWQAPCSAPTSRRRPNGGISSGRCATSGACPMSWACPGRCSRC